MPAPPGHAQRLTAPEPAGPPNLPFRPKRAIIYPYDNAVRAEVVLLPDLVRGTRAPPGLFTAAVHAAAYRVRMTSATRGWAPSGSATTLAPELTKCVGTFQRQQPRCHRNLKLPGNRPPDGPLPSRRSSAIRWRSRPRPAAHSLGHHRRGPPTSAIACASGSGAPSNTASPGRQPAARSRSTATSIRIGSGPRDSARDTSLRPVSASCAGTSTRT